MTQGIKKGTVHIIPLDMKKMILSSEELLRGWNDLTPLARNEWICWTTSVKKPETRKSILKDCQQRYLRVNEDRAVG